MKEALVILFMLLLVSSCATYNIRRESSFQNDILARYGVIIAEDETGGSCLIVGNGWIITAAHIIDNDSKNFSIISPEGIDTNAKVVKTIDDIVLIKSEVLGRTLPIVKFAEPLLWENVYWMAMIDFNMPPIAQISIVASRLLIENELVWALNIPVYPGASGSAVWNNKGKVIGIIVQYLKNEYDFRVGVFKSIPPAIQYEINKNKGE